MEDFTVDTFPDNCNEDEEEFREYLGTVDVYVYTNSPSFD